MQTGNYVFILNKGMRQTYVTGLQVLSDYAN